MSFRPATRLALLLVLAPAVTVAQERLPSPWYLGAHAGVTQLDDDAGASDEGVFLRGVLGRQLDHRLTLELEGSFGSVELDQAGDVDQTHIALNVVVVNREPSWNPYFLAGFGAFNTDSDSFSDTGAMAQVGIGGMWDLNGFGLMLRADLRYRYSDLDVEFVDKGQGMFSIGLDFPFGQ